MSFGEKIFERHLEEIADSRNRLEQLGINARNGDDKRRKSVGTSEAFPPEKATSPSRRRGRRRQLERWSLACGCGQDEYGILTRCGGRDCEMENS